MENYIHEQNTRLTAEALVEAGKIAKDYFPTDGSSPEAIRFYNFIVIELNALHGHRCNGRTASLSDAVKSLYNTENLTDDQIENYKYKILEHLTVIEDIFSFVKT